MSEEYIRVDDYLRLKLKRNKLYIKFLETHNLLLKKEMIISYRTFDLNNKKINIFNSINVIEEEQLKKFNEEQDEKTNKMYDNINNQDPHQMDELIEEIKNIRKEYDKLEKEIDEFNNTNPKILNIIR
jgi:esterase/lipase